jgi:hypothetical protein
MRIVRAGVVLMVIWALVTYGGATRQSVDRELRNPRLNRAATHALDAARECLDWASEEIDSVGESIRHDMVDR